MRTEEALKLLGVLEGNITPEDIKVASAVLGELETPHFS
jgi:hypothetical protein